MGWIIFPIGVGWRDVGRTIHRGSFECPNPRCKGKRSSTVQQFRVRQFRNWAVVFYIPVLPLNRLGAGVQCASCKSFFSLEALPEDELERLAKGVSYSPSSLAQVDDDGGFAEEKGVEAVLSARASFTPRPCPHCQAHMPRDASVCPSCERESTPWRFENGFWWTKGPQDAWYWLDEGAREWKRFEGELPEQVDVSLDDGPTASDALDPRSLIENSVAARPAFVLVADVTRPGLNENLDVEWSDMGWLEPADGEEILGRWLCLRAVCHVGVGENDGLPGALTRDGALATQLLFDGGGPLFLTNRRLVGWIGMGTTIFGQVDSKEGLLYTLPLEVIEQLDVTQEKGLGGAMNETGLVFWNVEGGSLFADLDRWVDESRQAHPANRTEAARTIVGAVAALQRETATPEQQAILDRALAGEWEVGDDYVLEIELAPPETETEPETAAAAPEAVAGVGASATSADPAPTLQATHADATVRVADGWGCRACGATNVETHRFCTSCGADREAAMANEEASDQDGAADSADLPVAAGCELCECLATPGEGDRFCRACGHPAEAHQRARGDAGLVTGLAACWSCDGPVAHDLSECPHCGVVLDQSWKESTIGPGG